MALPHPLDDEGLAICPPEIRLECDPERCRQEAPFRDRHHMYRPASEYQTRPEKDLRSHSRFVIRICRCSHEEWEYIYEPPPKPPINLIRRFKK